MEIGKRPWLAKISNTTSLEEASITPF